MRQEERVLAAKLFLSPLCCTVLHLTPFPLVLPSYIVPLVPPQCGIHTSSESVCLTLLPLGSELRHAMGGVAGVEKVGDAAAAGLKAHTIIVTMEIK